MKNFSQSIDQWFRFSSPLSKTGIMLIALSLLLTAISFAKGIQVLMFVPAFLVSLFVFSAWDYFLAKRKISIQIHKTTGEYTLLVPKNCDGFFFKLAIKIQKESKKKWQYLEPIKNTISWRIPDNTEQIKIIANGRLDIFQKFFYINPKKIYDSKQTSNTDTSNISIEINEYNPGDDLLNIDPKRSAMSDKIYIREKIFEEEDRQTIEYKKNMMKLFSNEYLQKFSQIKYGFIAEWVLIFLGFLGFFLQWGGIIFPLFFIISVGILWIGRGKIFPLPKKYLNPMALILFFGSIAEGVMTLDTALSGVHFLLALCVWKHAFVRERRDGSTYIFLILFVFIALSLYTLAAWFLFLFLLFLVTSGFLFTCFSGGEWKEEYSCRFGTPYTKKFFIKYFITLFTLTFLFFLILPHGENAKNTDNLLGKKTATSTGFTDQVSLNSVGSIKQNFGKKIIIENADENKIEIYQSLYWRGARFNSFNGVEWQKVRKVLKPFITTSRKKEGEEEINIKIYSDGQKNIFLPSIPSQIKKQSTLTSTQDGTIFERKEAAQSAFFMDVTLNLENPQNNGQKSENPSHCQSGKCIFSEEVKEIFSPFWEKIPANISSDPQKLSNYIQQNFSYSLENPAKNMTDFLYQSKQGHCEYFATVLAVTLQHFGYADATLVNGFHGGEWNKTANAWIVRQQNAHSWVEIFVDGKWQVLDPTPSSSIGAEKKWYQENFLSKAAINFYDAIEIKWNRFFVEFTGSKQKEFFVWVFSFWKFFIAGVFIFIGYKVLRSYFINIYIPNKNRSAKEKFLYALQKKMKQSSGLFLEKYKDEYPEVVKKTQSIIFGRGEINSRERDNIIAEWEKISIKNASKS